MYREDSFIFELQQVKSNERNQHFDETRTPKYHIVVGGVLEPAIYIYRDGLSSERRPYPAFEERKKVFRRVCKIYICADRERTSTYS